MDPNLRAADHDRQQVIDALHRHTVDGRLSLDEFTERVEAASRSRTYGDLAAITADLPSYSPSRRTNPGVATTQLLIAAGLLVALFAIAVLAALAGWGNMSAMMASMTTAMNNACR
jgi:hypothetical protein